MTKIEIQRQQRRTASALKIIAERLGEKANVKKIETFEEVLSRAIKEGRK
jgi:hypothetical protein